MNGGFVISQSTAGPGIFILFFLSFVRCPETSQRLQHPKALPNAVFGLHVHEMCGKYFISDAGIFALALTAFHVSDERPCINTVFPLVLIAL